MNEGFDGRGEAGRRRLGPIRSVESHAIRDWEQQTVSIRNLAFDPQGRMYKRPTSQFRRWWLKRRGWTIWGDDCRVE